MKNEDNLALWHRHKGGDQAAKFDLLANFKPLIKQQALKHSNVLPLPVVEAKLKQYAIQAFDSYDPHKKTLLSTHVVNHLQRINRDNYKHLQAIRLPEAVAMQYRKYSDAVGHLSGVHGREPTVAELAEHLGVSLRSAGSLTKKFHVEHTSGKQLNEVTMSESDTGASVAAHVYQALPRTEKYIFEHMTGYHGAPIYSSPEMIEKLGITQYEYYRLLNIVKAKVQDAYQVLGE